MVRESTNRASIAYCVERYRGAGGLRRRTVELVAGLAGGIADGSDDRIIVYCQTVELMEDIASDLGCPTYTGDQDTMNAADRIAAIRSWLAPAGSPTIIATSALGIGFDYPYVRWVVHAGPPRRMTDFSQESGRAGRDGKPARSIVLISAAWRPYGGGGGGDGGELQRPPEDTDEESMQLYLSHQHCLRAVMSQYLDARPDWSWCMEGRDELCSFCPTYHREPRPRGLQLELAPPPPPPLLPVESDMVYTGPEAVAHQQRLDEEVLDRLQKDLDIMADRCLLCRVKGKEDRQRHRAGQCPQRWTWLRPKKAILQSCQQKGKPWIEPYVACFMCYMPQSICTKADPESNAELKATGRLAGGCRYADMILPLCIGAFFATGPRAIIARHAARRFATLEDYMAWLGTTTELGGIPCIQAVRIAAKLLAKMLED
jgi:hypothetical protein